MLRTNSPTTIGSRCGATRNRHGNTRIIGLSAENRLREFSQKNARCTGVSGTISSDGTVRLTSVGQYNVGMKKTSIPARQSDQESISSKAIDFRLRLSATQRGCTISFPLSLRMVEEILATRGIELTYEAVRDWATKFGLAIASASVRRRWDGATNGTLTKNCSSDTVAHVIVTEPPGYAKRSCDASNRRVSRWAGVNSPPRLFNPLYCRCSTSTPVHCCPQHSCAACFSPWAGFASVHGMPIQPQRAVQTREARAHARSAWDWASCAAWQRNADRSACLRELYFGTEQLDNPGTTKNPIPSGSRIADKNHLRLSCTPFSGHSGKKHQVM